MDKQHLNRKNTHFKVFEEFSQVFLRKGFSRVSHNKRTTRLRKIENLGDENHALKELTRIIPQDLCDITQTHRIPTARLTVLPTNYPPTA